MWRLSTLLFLLLMSLTPGAQAQGAESSAQSLDLRARVAFEAGSDAYAHGRFGEALVQFEQAYAINAHPKLLFNIARAAEFDGQRERAIQAYRQYLAALERADNREFVEARLAKLEAELKAGAPRVEVPSAAETARMSARGEPAPHELPFRSDSADSRPFYKRGWFWGVLGGAVVAGVATALLMTLQKDGPSRTNADDYVLLGLGAKP